MKKTEEIKFWTESMGVGGEIVGVEYTNGNDIDDGWNGKQYTYDTEAVKLAKEAFADLDKDSSFLEIGCNIGRNINNLYDMGFTDISGIDILKYAIGQAETRYPDADLQVASVLELPYENDTFDVVYSVGVLMHINPTDIQTAMSEMVRVLKPGGVIWGYEEYAESYKDQNWRDSRNAWMAPFEEIFRKKVGGLTTNEKYTRVIDSNITYYLVKDK